MSDLGEIRQFNVFNGEAPDVRMTPYGPVGTMVDDHGVEVVWVVKQDEAIDPEWYSQEQLDVLYVVRGMLRIEFADDISATRTLKEGELLAIPPGTRCRAYRWPRESRERVIFLAITPHQAPDGRSAG
jgi:mannose-6-phosphate isomerase-like protein (cupin superfamily)